jgi:site-specific DNA-methyltransferase (adenine-specific)
VSDYQVIEGDCLEVMRTLPDNSVDLIATDPPYFKVKGEAWDRQWDKPTQFLDWLDTIAEQWQRILKPNGSLYCFASPHMAGRVEATLRRRFDVLNRVRWLKSAGWHNKTRPEDLRSFLSPWEEIVFAEHYGADNIAKGEAGYIAKCDDLRGFVFEPLRAYIAGEWERAGLTSRDANIATGTQMAGHYLTRSQWALPTKENYEKLREFANRCGKHVLRREYEDLRRPFSVTADVQFTDVWKFPTVQHYRGKHVCEKPIELMRHIVRASSRPGASVLDCFAGSGTTGAAAVSCGRSFIGIEKDPVWCARARARIQSTQELGDRAPIRFPESSAPMLWDMDRRRA